MSYVVQIWENPQDGMPATMDAAVRIQDNLLKALKGYFQTINFCCYAGR